MYELFSSVINGKLLPFIRDRQNLILRVKVKVGTIVCVPVVTEMFNFDF